MSNALMLAYGFGGVIFLALMGLFWGWLVKPVAPLALKSRAERENPMSAGCEMDAETLSEHAAGMPKDFLTRFREADGQ